MVTTLHRHVVQETVRPFWVALVVYTVVCLTQLIARLADLMLEGQLTLMVPAAMMLVTALPAAFMLAVPMAMSMAILTGCGQLAANGEILALRAAGHSPVSAFRPLLALSALASILSVAGAHWAVPRCNLRSTDQALVIQFRMLSDIPPGRPFEFTAESGSNAMIYYDSRDEATGEMVNVVLRSRPRAQTGRTTQAGDGEVFSDTVITAARGRIVPDLEERMIHIVLTSGTLHLRDRLNWGATRFETLTRGVHPLFSRTQTGVFRKTAREMTTPELWPLAWNPPRGKVPMKWSTVREIEATADFDMRLNYSYRLELLLRLSLPFASLAMALVSFPLALRTRPVGNAAGFALSLLLIAVYYGLTKIAAALTLNGLSAGPPAFGAANLLLAGIGLYWLAKLSRE